MTTFRKLASRLLSVGVISAGWYSVLTGSALLVVGVALASTSPSDDPAAPVVGVLFVLAGVWQVERGLRSEFRRHTRPIDEN